MNFLTDKTSAVFDEISGFDLLKSFTFVGGSAAAYYLNHRLSEDLDFFTWGGSLPLETDLFIKKISKNRQIQIVNSDIHLLDIFIDGIKFTFFANDWEILRSKRSLLKNNIFIADPDLLCAMKVNVLTLRAKFRDYYDLYIFNKNMFGIDEIYEFALKYVPGMTKKIFLMQMTYIDDIEDENIDHLEPRYKVSLKTIQKHFENELPKIMS